MFQNMLRKLFIGGIYKGYENVKGPLHCIGFYLKRYVQKHLKDLTIGFSEGVLVASFEPENNCSSSVAGNMFKHFKLIQVQWLYCCCCC